MNKTQGFSVVEVLVALVLVAVAILGLAKVGSESVSWHYGLEQRTLGQVVAANVLADIKLSASKRPGQASGQSTLAGRTWYWRSVMQPTADGSMLRVDVGIYGEANGENPIVIHTGFVAP